MKIILALGFMAVVTLVKAQPTTSDAWINEFHYDGTTQYGQQDMNEFLEIAIKTTIATDPLELAKYKVILYTSGAYDAAAWTTGKGLPYNVSSLWYSQQETEHPLSSFTACPVSSTQFTLLSKPMPTLQDVPAAFALVYENSVIQLLSYEEAFKIATTQQGGGPASGMTTELINNMGGMPAMETATTPNQHSVSLVGTGTSYNSFTWDDGVLVMATPCAPNNNTITTQNFSSPLPVRWLAFSAIGARENIIANWRVATETGVSNYVVEVAKTDGSFKTEVSKAYDRNANGSYEAIIPNLKPGVYTVRIKSRMITGDVEYSETKVVRLMDMRTDFVSVFPNPVRGANASLTIVPVEKDRYTIELVDANGKRISSLVTPELPANTLHKTTVPIKVPAGIYQLKVTGKRQVQTLKIVVL